MNILVLNGSPKGKNSITLQTVEFLSKKRKGHTFDYLHVGGMIKAFEKDFDKFNTAEKLKNADLIIFSYPVYTFIAPSQLHRFIELIRENGVDLSGKWATQLTTSKHFYDVTAHNFIKDNCADMGMNFAEGLSADMEDLLAEQGQAEALNWFDYTLWCVENGVTTPVYTRSGTFTKNPVGPVTETAEKQDKDVVIVTDCRPDDTQLRDMIAAFRKTCKYKTRVENIRNREISGGCLGCFNCAIDGKCIYKDGFDSYLRDDIQQADTIIYAFTINGHSMGSRFKMFDDRQFCNGHRTVTIGMPMGYIISGDFSKEENLRVILEARANVGQNIYLGAATDEADTARSIETLAARLEYALENKNTTPQNFYGVGGMRIFRDLIYEMQGMMQADHKFYKNHGIYKTFPQRKKATILKMYRVGMLLKNKKLKAAAGGKMTEGMLMPYRKVIDNIKD